MNILQAIILGILQGATEFLPVSSSGHLVLIPWICNWPTPPLVYDVIVHLGTLVAVLVYLWSDILRLLRGLVQIVQQRRATTPDAKLALYLIVSAVPGAVLGFLLDDFFESLFGSPLTVSLLLVVTGALLLLSERLGKRQRDLDAMTTKDALTMGLAQGLAIAPGISRSGATMAAGMFRDLDRPTAARFSFLMSVPIIMGAAGYQALKLLKTGTVATDGGLLIAGFIAAAASGYLAIRLLLGLVRSHSLRPFAFYCWAAAVLGTVLSIVR